MSGDRIVHAKCVGAEPTSYQDINGWKFLFEAEELENGKASKVFWMGPDTTAKAKKYWAEILAFMGFDPAGKTAEEWSRIGQSVAGASVVLVMEMKEKNGRMRESVKFINAPGGRTGEGDITETCNAAASMFGGAQASLPLAEPAPASGYDDDVPF
jgi:hypothetical protein